MCYSSPYPYISISENTFMGFYKNEKVDRILYDIIFNTSFLLLIILDNIETSLLIESVLSWLFNTWIFIVGKFNSSIMS